MSKKPRTTAAGDATRVRILDAAWTLVVERGLGVSMRDIAAAAHVTRQTVYFHFESRAGLLVAMARHRDHAERIGERFRAARAAPTARQALTATIRAWYAYLPRVLPVARALQNAAATDDAAASAWWDRMDAVRLVIRRVIQRLADDHDLDESWSVDEATDILWSITHPRAWDDLINHHGWSPTSLVERHIQIAHRILLAPDDPEARPASRQPKP